MCKHNTKPFFLLCSISADNNKITRTGSCLGQGFDHVHQPVSGSNVHTAVLIGQTSVRDNWSALTELWQSVISCWSAAAITVRLMKEAENQSGTPHCELDQLRENLISWRWKLIHAERRTRTQFIIQIHDIQQRNEQKHNRIFSHTHTHLCCFRWAMARWPMSRLYTASGKPTAATPWLAACRASSRDDLTAVTDKTRPPLETTPPSFKAVPAWKICSPMSWIRDNPEEEPRCYTNSSKHYNVPAHSIYPKNLDVVFSVKHLQKLMHYIYNLIIFCNKMCIFLIWVAELLHPQNHRLKH